VSVTGVLMTGFCVDAAMRHTGPTTGMHVTVTVSPFVEVVNPEHVALEKFSVAALETAGASSASAKLNAAIKYRGRMRTP
jgi:hypothetical protein